jgi:hypothetical protein
LQAKETGLVFFCINFFEKFSMDYICDYGRAGTEIIYMEFVAWLPQIQ